MYDIQSFVRVGRAKKNWKQYQLAKKLNTSSTMVSKWERGHSVPSAAAFVKMIDLFGMEIVEKKSSI